MGSASYLRSFAARAAVMQVNEGKRNTKEEDNQQQLFGVARCAIAHLTSFTQAVAKLGLYRQSMVPQVCIPHTKSCVGEGVKKVKIVVTVFIFFRLK